MSADDTTIGCCVVSVDQREPLRACAQRVSQTLAQCREVTVIHALGAASGDRVHAILLVCNPASLASALNQMAQLRADWPHAALLLLAEEANVNMLAMLMSAGAYDFALMPVRADELLARIRRAVGVLPASGAQTIPGVLAPRMRNFVGASPEFARQVAKLPTFAGCDAGVLIMGETGTGKEVCAQAIHYLSARASKPWVAVNCGAIPTELIESELFGHVKGAYTTAHASREGLVGEAEGGTLFLDDVDCLPLPAQAKLLRFLQEREYRAVGSNAVHIANVRVIAASNQNLAQKVAQGTFRQDLYFRLNVLNLELPALRRRREDIPALTLHFIGQFAQQFGRSVGGLAPRAMQRLLAHEWPGNVRELKHVIERAVLLCTGPMLTEVDLDLGDNASSEQTAETFAQAKARVVEHFERSYLKNLMATHSGNVTHAAQTAQKNRRAFFELLRKHHIAPEHYRARRA